jgi:hypothetical protein
LIHVTTDGGGNWKNITPAQLKPWQKISIIDASHFDRGTAYAAVNTLRLDDLRPHIYRTRDSGASWTEITNGIPANENVNVVREDWERRGLLFAGTERAVYVSFDDGDHWQSLRLNMAASSVRDLIVKGDDLCAATHGRGFWILDDIRPLRQLDTKITTSQAFLFTPQTAIRVRWNTNTDTPLPPDVPAGENPPDGAVIDYYLGASSSGPVTLEILDAAGEVVRRYSSADPVPRIDPMLAIPAYWVRPPQVLSSEPGMHRFLWDMRYAPIPGAPSQYPISAVYHNTAPAASSPWAMPGKYTVRLTANGKSFTQPLMIQMDPRLKVSASDLAEQFKLSKQAYDELLALAAISESIRSIRGQLTDLRARAADNVKTHLDSFSEKLQTLGGAQGFGPGGPGGGGGGGTRLTVASAAGRLRALFGILQGVDSAPTPQVAVAVAEVLTDSQSLSGSWQAIKSQDIPALNQELQAAGLPAIQIEKKN